MKQKLENALHHLLPNMGNMLWIAAFAGALGLGPRMMNIDGDLGRHLTIGQFILDQGQIPVRDLFSHTMLGQPVTPHEWLSQVVFALAYRWLGLDGVVLLTALVIATSFWLVFRLTREQSQSVLAAVLVMVLALAASSLHWLTRPHIFTFLMLALWMNLLENLRLGRLNRWWLFPLVMLFWANLHGAFVAGFVTWAIYGIGLAWDAALKRFPKGRVLHGRFWRYYLAAGGAAFLATLANPSGIGLWGTSVGYVGNQYLVSHTAEYLPPNFHQPATWPFLLLIGLLIVLLGLQSRRAEAAHIFTTAAWLVMALYSTRNIPLFVIVSAPLIASVLADLAAVYHHLSRGIARIYQMDLRLQRVDSNLHGMLWPALTLALALFGLSSGARYDFQQSGNAFSPQVFPVSAVDWLQEQPQKGKPFNYFPWGGYLLYRLWPEQTVFIDGQTDFYGETLTRQYEQVLTVSPGWEEVLRQYQVQWVILPPAEPLAKALRNRPGWKLAYQDETAVILVNTEP